MGALQCGIKFWVEKGEPTSPLLFWYKPASLVLAVWMQDVHQGSVGELHPASL